MSWLDDLNDVDELNRHLAADPGLAENMAEMGFVKRVGFHADHNNNLTAKWEFTEYGRREMLARLADGFDFAVKQGKEQAQ